VVSIREGGCDVQNRLILCVGFRGSGKSTVASSILKPNDGIFVFDPHGDDPYRWIRNTSRNVEELEDYSRWRREGKPETRAVIRYIPDARLDPFDTLNDFCAWVWTWRNVWICIEEVSESCKGVSAQGMPPELRRLVNQGRHKGLNQIYCGIRLPEIPTPIRDGANVQIVFFSRDTQTRDLIAQRLGREALQEFESLGLHEALIIFRDGSYQTISSRDAGLAELVLRDGANVSENVGQERP
jgi:hypothetical protein